MVVPGGIKPKVAYEHGAIGCIIVILIRPMMDILRVMYIRQDPSGQKMVLNVGLSWICRSIRVIR